MLKNWLLRSLFICIHMCTCAVQADIISQDRKIAWTPGIPGGYPEKTFEIDVMEYGATGDGKTNDTNAFRNALNAFPAEGGR